MRVVFGKQDLYSLFFCCLYVVSHLFFHVINVERYNVIGVSSVGCTAPSASYKLYTANYSGGTDALRVCIASLERSITLLNGRIALRRNYLALDREKVRMLFQNIVSQQYGIDEPVKVMIDLRNIPKEHLGDARVIARIQMSALQKKINSFTERKA